jgi:hypothetical protein
MPSESPSESGREGVLDTARGLIREKRTAGLDRRRRRLDMQPILPGSRGGSVPDRLQMDSPPYPDGALACFAWAKQALLGAWLFKI